MDDEVAPLSRVGAILRAAARRTASVGVSAAGAAGLVVLLFVAVPGDAIDALANGPELRAQLEAEWGLGGGPLARLGHAVSRVVRLDLGSSLTFRPGAPVAGLATDAMGTSATLLLPALGVGLAAVYLLAVLAPVGQGGVRRAAARAAVALTAPPVVLLGLAVVLGLNALTWSALERGLIVRPAWFALPEEPGVVRSALATAVLAFGSAQLGRLTGAARREWATLDAAGFMLVARAHDLPLGALRLRHLLAPTARLAAAQVPTLASALIVVERGFAIPGAGSMFWEACRLRDWPLALGLTLGAAAVTAGATLAAQLVAVVVDPRERREDA